MSRSCDQHRSHRYAKIHEDNSRFGLSYFAKSRLSSFSKLHLVHYIKMINIYICLFETTRSLKFSARFNPTVFRIALLSLLRMIYTQDTL